MLTMYSTKADFNASGITTAIVPIGATEQHGSHLPVGTDTLIAEALAMRLGEELNAFVLPALAITSSIEHRFSKGTVYLKADTLALLVRDVCESLLFSGYRKIVLVNGHGGNWILKPTVRQLNRDLADRGLEGEIVLLPTSVVVRRQGEVTQHVHNDIHAGEKETSLMLYLCEQHVRAPVAQTAAPDVPQDYMDYFDMTELTEDGYWGYPESASKEKGERLLALMTECALDYLRQLDLTREAVRERRESSEQSETPNVK